MNSAFQAMYNLLQSDRRYKFEAYNFVRESLNRAQQKTLVASVDDETDEILLESSVPESNHITGQQL